MANFKRRRHKGARAGCLMCKPHKVSGSPPDGKFRSSELRKLGGRGSRVRRRDVDWTFRDDD
jgi:hypothetical protein